MPVSDVERAVGQFRRALLQKERAAASEMVRVYGEAWQRVQVELVHLDVEYKALLAAGQKPDRAWIYQQGRMQAMRSQIESELHRYTEYAYETVRREQAAAIASAEEHAEVLTRRALGRAPVGISVQWNRIPTGAVEQIIGMGQADSPLKLLLAEIAPRGAQAAMDVLIQGLLLGNNPRSMAGQLRGILGGELFRSLRIARTETLRAYREATRLSYKANDDIVEGWIWHSAADKRTCGSCWAMHGTVHKLSETLNDHPNGRCSMVPQTKTWAEIGKAYGIDLSDVPETRADVELGASLFGKLSREEQIGVLGPAKWAAWRDGRITLDGNPVSGIVGVRKNTVWGSMRYERSLRGILGQDEATKYTRLALMGVATKDNLTPLELAKSALAGATLDSADVARLLAAMEQAPFSSRLVTINSKLVGQSYLGHVIRQKEPSRFAHLVKRVLGEHQWADGTTEEIYENDLRKIFTSSNLQLAVYKRKQPFVLAFADTKSVVPTERLGVQSRRYIGAFYNTEYGTISSCYQFSNIDALDLGKSEIVWLQKTE